MSYQDWPGFSNHPRQYVDYNRVYDIIIGFEPQFRAHAPEMVLGILRGGAIPAAMVSQRLALPVEFIAFHRANPIPELPSKLQLAQKKVLLIDDFSSSGETFKSVVKMLKELGANPVTCALYHDPKRTSFIPDISHPAENFIVFPWERMDLSQESQEIIKMKNGKVAMSDQKEFIGIDLDGVLVKDIRRKWYAKHPIGSILNLRDRYLLADPLPNWKPHQAAVITGRPMEDFTRTREWLNKNNLNELSLFCRDTKLHGASLTEMANHKASHIHRMGITTFYESDLRQALIIAESCPYTDVIWWGKRKQVRLTASSIKR